MAARVKMPCARAVHGFQGQSSHELDFSAGVSILLLRRIDENWLEGKLEGRVGIFPASHVKIEVGSPSMAHENALASSGKPYALALHTFQGTQHGDLSFSKGDLIELVGDVSSSTGWLKGKINSTTGIFPASFVEILRYPKAKEVPEDVVDTVDGIEKDLSLPPGPTQPGEERPRPIPKPRTRLPSRGHDLVTVQNKATPPTTPSNLTPSRSAPAPPTPHGGGPQSTGKHDSLPRPTKPPPSVLPYGTMPKSKSKSLTGSSSSSRVDILKSELAVEQKLLESAESLLVADGQSPAKNEKRNRAISTHKSKISHLHAAITEAKESEESLLSSSTPPPIPPPPRPTLPVTSSKEQLRAKVIDELVFTERDFHHQMELCSSKVLPALRQVPEIQEDTLFGNMAEVTALSGNFLRALEEACQKDKQAAVGGVFVTFAPKMKSVYGVYCGNHDNAATLYEKYMETPATADSIHQAMDMLRGEIQAWDLQSLLIKPVQRILKYPLLLSSLVEKTEDSHPDYKVLLNAKEAIGRVAQDINEIKRRKDLVVKYTGSKDERKSISVHSFQKKMRRFRQQLTQFTGLRSKTIDPKFDEMEQKVMSLETLIQNLLRDIGKWQDQLQDVADSRVTLLEGMLLYCSSQLLKSYQTFVSQFQQAVKTQAKFVREHVTVPLESLLSLFQNPLHLIQKRKDKLLDYDDMQYALDHAEESEKISQLREESLLAKRNYEALNTQLLEELPCFIEAVVNMLYHQLTVLVQAQYSFSSAVAELFPPLLAACSSPSPSSSPQHQATTHAQVQQQHAKQMLTVCKDLAKLSLVPTSLSHNYSLRTDRTRPSESSLSPSDQPEAPPDQDTVSPDQQALACPPVTEENDQEEEEEEEESDDNAVTENVELESDLPTEGTRVQVLYDFISQDPAELSVCAGEVVVLLCAHDRLGCEEWWLVQLQTHLRQQGYVPATYLTPHIS